MDMDLLVCFIIAVCCHDVTLSNKLELLISNHARLGNNIWVTCSADIIPQENIAEFLVDGVTSDIILRQRDGCFSSITRTSCSPSTCNCSDDGKIYSLKINVNQQIESVNITCSMRFKINKEVFKTEAVNIKTIDNNQESPTTTDSNRFTTTLDAIYSHAVKERTLETSTDLASTQALQITNTEIESTETDLASTQALQITNTEIESTETENSALNNYGVIGGCLILGLCFLFASIILKCFKSRTTDQNRSQNSVQSNVARETTGNLPSIRRVSNEYDVHDYESINESEMLHDVLSSIQIREPHLSNATQLPSSSSSNSNATHPSSISSSTNSQDNSYLEVIDDDNYLNPYQMIKTEDGSENKHTYCLITHNHNYANDSFCLEVSSMHTSHIEQIDEQ